MKKLSELVNNKLSNHLTPVDNIITMVKNLYAELLGILVQKTEDGTGVVLKSSEFKCQTCADKIIYKPMYRGKSIAEYIMQMGLDSILVLPIDAEQSEWFVLCTATDLNKKSAKESLEDIEDDKIIESFNTTLYSFYEAEEEYNDKVDDDSQIIIKVKDILNDQNIKVVQKAQKIDSIIRSKIKLGENWKFKAIKDDNGNVFVALRNTYKAKRPFNYVVNITTSRLALLNAEDKGVFVYDADNRDSWGEEHEDIISKILKLLKCIRNNSWDSSDYSIGNAESSEENKNDNNDSNEESDKESNKEDNKENDKEENTKENDQNNTENENNK